VVVIVLELSLVLILHVLNNRIVFVLLFLNLSFEPANDSFLINEHSFPRL
jgi:hypothetical protein